MDRINTLLVYCLEQRRAHCINEMQEILMSGKMRFSQIYCSVYIDSDDNHKSFDFRTYELLGTLIKRITDAKNYSSLLEMEFSLDELAQIIKATTAYGNNFGKIELQLLAELILIKANE